MTPALRNWRLIAIIGALSVTVFALGSVVYAPHDEYVRLLYLVVPAFVWVAFIASLLAGLWLVYLGAQGNHRAWRYGIVLLVCSYLVFWFFPTIAGLRFWSAPRGDLLGHFGKVKAILATGENPSGNMYPGLHWLLATLASVSGLRLGLLQPTVTAVYYTAFIMGVYAFSKLLFGTRVARYTVFAAAPLVYSKYVHSIMPWFASFALVPLVLVLAERERTGAATDRVPVLLAGIVLSVSIVFIHPMTSLVVVGTFGVGVLAVQAVEVRTGTRIRRPPLEWGAILLLPHFAWYMAQLGFQRRLSTAIVGVVTAEPGASSKAARAGETSYTIAQLFWRFIVLDYGVALIYPGLGLLVAMYIAYRYRRGAASERETILVGLYLFGVGIAVAMVLFGLIISNLYRMNQVTLLASIVLIGLGLYWLEQSTQRPVLRALARGVLVFGVVGASVLAPFMIYDEQRHVVDTEMAGAEFHVTHQNGEFQTRSFAMSHQLTMFVVGDHKSPNYRRWAFRRHDPTYQLPRRLATESGSVGSLFDSRGYMITKTRDTVWYRNQPTNRWPSLLYITEDDLRRVRADETAARTYSNGEFTIWYVTNRSARVGL
ncbi:hypothetical protein [Haloarchaeobius sp. HRN-SO-5]|uniref:hypothetical protein n=1 Tax=Haloarchaeobius sp. HRN-SO-5 TaxID=3446118 RepID=UPI003EB94187